MVCSEHRFKEKADEVGLSQADIPPPPQAQGITAGGWDIVQLARGAAERLEAGSGQGRCALKGSQWHCWRTDRQGFKAAGGDIHTGDLRLLSFETNPESTGMTVRPYVGRKVERMPKGLA